MNEFPKSLCLHRLMGGKAESHNAVEKIFGKLFVAQSKKNLAFFSHERIVMVQLVRMRSSNVRLIFFTTT